MSKFKFSVGPWNVHSGADSYGPATRREIDFDTKLAKFAEMGFSAIQFHDDDAVPDINNYTEEEIREKARELKKKLDKYGLAAEFVAPRLWMDGHTVEGGFMKHVGGRPGIRHVEGLSIHRHRQRIRLRYGGFVAGKGRNPLRGKQIPCVGYENAGGSHK